MPGTFSSKKSVNEIGEMAARGEDVSAHSTNKFTVVRPIQPVNVDLTPGMPRELDSRAAKLNVTRQAVINMPLGQALIGPAVNTSRKKNSGRRHFCRMR